MREDGGGEAVGCGVGEGEGLLVGGEALERDDGAEDLFLLDAAGGIEPFDDGGLKEGAVAATNGEGIWLEARPAAEDAASEGACEIDERLDLGEVLAAGERALLGGGVLRVAGT